MTTSTIDRSAWEQTTHRQRTLRALTTAACQDPNALQDAVRRARSEAYDSLDSLLLDAHALWMRTFDAGLDAVLEQGGYGDQRAIEELWSDTARALAGTAILLDAYAEHPAIVRAHAQHVQRMRRTVGVELPHNWTAPRPVRKPAGRIASLRGRARALLAH